MKNIISLLLILILFTSCITKSDILDLSNKGYHYVVIDTTHTGINGFDKILNYYVIVEIDSTLYSATMTTQGIITELDRKLKVKK